MWREHFQHLCYRAFLNALAMGGSTLAGIVVIGIFGIVLGFVFTVMIEGGRSKWDREILRAFIRTWPPYLGAIAGLLLAWILLFAFAISTTVYSGHQALVSQRDVAVRDLNRFKQSSQRASSRPIRAKRGEAEPTNPSQNADQQLAQEAVELAGNIRGLSRYWLQRMNVIVTGSDAEPVKRTQREDLGLEVMGKYNRDYKADSNNVHSRLLQALKPGDEDLNLTLYYERGFNPDSLEMNASDLERLAKKLDPDMRLHRFFVIH
ncbi:MAG: YesL family protein [Janthinobacterium lividum]